jgi:L-serine/L-threonine ammonia-lyase
MYTKTPYVWSYAISQRTKKSVFLKLENNQPSGSFKLRGVSNLCKVAITEQKFKFISSSGGNAGIAVAYCGKYLDTPVDVYVPSTTSHKSIAILQQLDANVVIYGESWAEANRLAQSNCTADDLFVHPFDDARLWEGHGTLVDEISETPEGKPDAIVVAVGGGGLLSGVVRGLLRNGWDDVDILAVETIGAASLNKSYELGQLTALDRIDTIATSLGAKQICEFAFSARAFMNITPVVVTDSDAINACYRFLDDHNVLVEPACGAALSLVYEEKYRSIISKYDSVAMVVCGGVTFSVEKLMASYHGKR